MTDMERQLLLKVHDGDQDNLPFLHLLFQYKGRTEMLLLLMRRGLKGKILTDFVINECQGEPLRFLHWLLKEVNNVNQPTSKNLILRRN